MMGMSTTPGIIDICPFEEVVPPVNPPNLSNPFRHFRRIPVMDRRRFLRHASVLGMVGLVGCTGDDGTPEATPTPTSTPATTPTPTPTPSPTPIERDPERTIAQRIGATHVAGRYHFTGDPFLWEGADVLETLGMRTVHAYLHRTDFAYPYNHDWPAFDSLVEKAQHEYYAAFFDRDFDTFVLTAYAIDPDDPDSWHPYVDKLYEHDFTDADAERVEDRFYDLASHFYEAYHGTGKEFVLHNWETDWRVIGDHLADVDEAMFDHIERWQRARQAGVRRAQDEHHDTSDVTVLHACEVVRVTDAVFDDLPRVSTHVIPEVDLDLVSYSTWDIAEMVMHEPDDDKARAKIETVLDFLEAQLGRTTPYAEDFIGDLYRPVYLGEFGWQERRHGSEESMRVVELLTETSLEWGVPFAVYWQLYDNNHDNGELTGNWLIDDEGEQTQFYEYFEGLLEEGLG